MVGVSHGAAAAASPCSAVTEAPGEKQLPVSTFSDAKGDTDPLESPTARE